MEAKVTRQIKIQVISVLTRRARQGLQTFIRPHRTMSSQWKSCVEDNEKNVEIIYNVTAPSRGRRAGRSHPLRDLVTWVNVDVDLQTKERLILPPSLLHQLRRPRHRGQLRVDRGDRVQALLCPTGGQSRPEILRKNFSLESRVVRTLSDRARRGSSTTEVRLRPDPVHHKLLLQKEAFCPELAATFGGAKCPTLHLHRRCRKNLLRLTRVQVMAFKTPSTSPVDRTRPSTGPPVTRGCLLTLNARR